MDVTEIAPLTRRAMAELFARRLGSKREPGRGRQRKHPRWPFAGPVELWLEENPGVTRHVLATCENLSLEGVGIRCDERLEPGSELELAVHQPEQSFHGWAVVRHCTRFEQDYYCGLEFMFDS